MNPTVLRSEMVPTIMLRILFVAVVLMVVPKPVLGHFHLLLPDRPSLKVEEKVLLVYQFGHPFEHQLFDTQKPTELFVVAPDGKRTDLLNRLEKITVDGAEGKKVTGFRFTYTPEKRGDYTFVAISPPVKVDGEELPLRDVAKVVVHVQSQNGWDQRVLPDGNTTIEVSPLTRPYGLTRGLAFQVEAEESIGNNRAPLVKTSIEVEYYNSIAPAELPPDEQITRTARTNRAGSATVTLTEPGWWSITGRKERDSQLHRCTLWIYVDNEAGK